MPDRSPSAEPLVLTTSDGVDLEAEVLHPEQAVGSAVVCHPHPLYGGNMYNHVVGGLFTELGKHHHLTVVRFNFRSVGRSGGDHDGGEAETDDVAAALDWLNTHGPKGPRLLAGYSFGAMVALNQTDPGHDGWLAVAPPLGLGGASPSASLDDRPVLVATGTRDQFCPASTAQEVTAGWANTRVLKVENADHGFATGLDQIYAEVDQILADLIRPDEP